MLQWLVICLSFLSILEPVKLHETDVSEMLQSMNILLGTLVTKSNTQLREVQSLRADLTSLNNSVTGLNDSVRSLHEQFTEHREQMVTTNTRAQQTNMKLNTLISDFSQHKQQTAAELTQLQDLFTQLHQNLTTRLTQQLETTQGYTEQQVSETLQNIDISLVSLITRSTSQLREFRSFTQLHQNLKNNLTHQLTSIQHYLESDPSLPVHTCGGTGGWRRVVYLDMTAPSTTCPSGWQLTGHSKRSCGIVSTTSHSCDSVIFPVHGGEYSRVCGRVKAYQYSATDAFEAYHNGHATTIDSAYVAGVSVTHGSPRQHIWTFAAGIIEVHPTRTYADLCPCDAQFTIRIPPFVGDDYFCESGVNVGNWGGFRADDPLWDGQNCTSNSTCCLFNTPPYFVKQLPTSTTDSIEARLCQQDSGDDSPVELIELYVQ